MNHTHGPWSEDGAVVTGGRLDEYRKGEHYFQIDAPTPKGADKQFPYTVADTSNRHHCISPEEDAANARLIAAAPELLETLKEAYAFLEGGDAGTDREPLEIIAAMREAIAKAEGRPA